MNTPPPLNRYRVWPDGTVQAVEDGPPHSHMSDDFAVVAAHSEEDALYRALVCGVPPPASVPAPAAPAAEPYAFVQHVKGYAPSLFLASEVGLDFPDQEWAPGVSVEPLYRGATPAAEPVAPMTHREAAAVIAINAAIWRIEHGQPDAAEPLRRARDLFAGAAPAAPAAEPDTDPEDDPPAHEASDWSPPLGYDGDGSVAAMAARATAVAPGAAPAAPAAEPVGYLWRSRHSAADAQQLSPGDDHGYLWKYSHGTSSLAACEANADLEVMRLYATPAQSREPLTMSAITGIRLATELRDSMCTDCKTSWSGASCCQPSRREALEQFDAERARAAHGIGSQP